MSPHLRQLDSKELTKVKNALNADKIRKNYKAIRVSEYIGVIVCLRCDLYEPASLPIGFERIYLG